MVWLFVSIALLFIFFFNDTATTEIYTLSLHDALPIFCRSGTSWAMTVTRPSDIVILSSPADARSEEHTSELQSQSNLVCRLLLEKKKRNKTNHSQPPSTAQPRPSKNDSLMRDRPSSML